MALEIVSTKYGQVRGVIEEDVLLFKGVPYAAPPVGELRWKEPQDPAPWQGVRDCDTYGPRPVQPSQGGLGFEPWASDFYYMGYTAYSEDCLYLNIATDAQSPEEKRPVYMWFHGGGLSSGYSYEVEFNPAVLAKKGIVVVTVGQRLNVFGYLSLPQLSAEQGGISGNYGLMDEVKALNWVRENIAAFGGDPDNITIGGQSGGTAKTGALARCPQAQGKVKRVINQSSLNWTGTYPAMAEAEQEGVRFIESLGFRADASLEELRAADCEVFNITGGNPFDKNAVRKPGNMVFDGKWVPEQDAAVSFDKYAGGLDYLAGGNYGECVMSKEFALGGRPIKTAADFYAKAKEMLGEELYNKYDFENAYPVSDEEANVLSKHLAVEGLTGFGGNMKNLCFGEYRAKKFPGAKTYSYVFSHITPSVPDDKKNPLRDPDIMMAWHSSELWYTFASLRVGRSGASNVPPIRPWTEYDVELAEKMSSYWANFIKTGDPNGEGLPHWPASGENHGWMDLGDELVSHEGLEGKREQMLYEYAAEKMGLPKA